LARAADANWRAAGAALRRQTDGGAVVSAHPDHIRGAAATRRSAEHRDQQGSVLASGRSHGPVIDAGVVT
jgi:hypothetical protein